MSMLTVYGSISCIHCRSIANLLTYKNIPFQFIETNIDDVEINDDGVIYRGFHEALNFINQQVKTI
jgi:arsenate reductase-like glutaredoxin family protein